MGNSEEYEPDSKAENSDDAPAAPTESTEAAASDSASSKATDPEQFRKLFIGGLSITTTDEGLRAFYAQWGEVVDCVVMRDPMSGKSRGFGFVAFANQDEVDACMASRPHVIDGKTVDPKRALPREQSIKGEAVVSTKRMFVSGIREDHTEDMLSSHFSQFGRIEKAEIVPDKDTGKPRGFAFITFDDHDAVDKCVLQRSHMIGGHRCDVKKALSKEEMAQAAQKDRERIERGQRSRGMGRGGGYAGARGADPYASSGYGWSGDNSQWSGYGGYGYGGYNGNYAGGGWNAQSGGWQSAGQYASQYGAAGTATENAVQAAAWSGGYGGSGGMQGGSGGGSYAPAGVSAYGGGPQGPQGAPAGGGPAAQWNGSTAGGGHRGY